MRALNLSATLIVSLVLFACSHANSMPKERRLAGIKQSILPIFVIEHSVSERWGFTGKSFSKRNIADFRACSAVYVAPNLLATSASAFERENYGVTMYDPDSIAILSGDEWLYSSDVPFFDPETGLVLIRTYAAGAPMHLRDGPLDSTEILQRAGYTFNLAPSGVLAIPSWDMGKAVAKYPIESLFSIKMFSVRTEVHIGNCGAAIVGSEGRLIGIIHKRIGDEDVSVISPAAIDTAIKSVR
jgi:hypothetical protein